MLRSKEEIEPIADRHGLPHVSPKTITNKDELLSNLEEVQKRNYAIDSEERLKSLRCIESTRTDENNSSGAAISIPRPVYCVDDTQVFQSRPDTVLRTASVIELEYSTRKWTE